MGLAERPARPPLHRGQKDCFGGTPKVRAGLALTFETRALLGTQTYKSVFLSIFGLGLFEGAAASSSRTSSSLVWEKSS